MTATAGDTEVLALAKRGLTRARAPIRRMPERLLVVDIAQQRVHLIEDGRITLSAAVSTSVHGVGGEEGSNRTPLGWHRVAALIGGGAEPGTVFKSREPNGEVWRGEARADDLITTRILWLDGLEPGINRGPGCDSRERYIYFHGRTTSPSRGGTVLGCIRMSNADVVGCLTRAGGDMVGQPASNDMPDPGSARFHYAGVGGSGMRRCAVPGCAAGRGAAKNGVGSNEAEAGQLMPRRGVCRRRSGLREAARVCPPHDDTARRRPGARAHRPPPEMLAHCEQFRWWRSRGRAASPRATAMMFEIARRGARPVGITGGDLVTPRRGYWGMPGRAAAARGGSRRERRLACALPAPRCGLNLTRPQG
jgi:UDP-N-acetylmuramate--alanine ligase